MTTTMNQSIPAGDAPMGTRVTYTLTRLDRTGAVVPWTIVGTIDSRVNDDASVARGAARGVRLVDAVCDDPMCDHGSHRVSVQTYVTVVA